jgi:hypothetical protein
MALRGDEKNKLIRSLYNLGLSYKSFYLPGIIS